nr:D-glycero-beta-D-manno-heptose 1,7-bisphosphate 7-phosphatase [uncultured Schaedlerella sp.]
MAVFLDRDGTINREKYYLYRQEDFEWIPGARDAIRTFVLLGYKVFIITNQSGIARGYYTEEDVKLLHHWMDEELRQAGAKVDGYYYCPHHPEAGYGDYQADCGCRKPRAGLFWQAVREHGITDLKNSWAVGDRMRDLEPAGELGCQKALVLTGQDSEEELAEREDIKVFEDIGLFAKWLGTGSR